ncbi:hypothetical protein H6P81_005227 [Aristolochia fimbriata]|uniref:Uncharacterized protein n=1 Tax=Aristolochia fimbriata TaxID=158543 RepID=A0AAV7EUD6_ARIFI|nr:hypothetical protein H6P81_005227 [Aristolochia fimbriata]
MKARIVSATLKYLLRFSVSQSTLGSNQARSGNVTVTPSASSESGRVRSLTVQIPPLTLGPLIFNGVVGRNDKYTVPDIFSGKARRGDDPFELGFPPVVLINGCACNGVISVVASYVDKHELLIKTLCRCTAG